jgi:hypothetical protein
MIVNDEKSRDFGTPGEMHSWQIFKTRILDEYPPAAGTHSINTRHFIYRRHAG